MRKIVIDDKIRALADMYYQQIVSTGTLVLINRAIGKLIDAILSMDKEAYINYVYYLRFIRLYLPRIITIQPNQIKEVSSKLENRWHCDMKWLMKNKRPSFSERVVYALHYTKIRESIFPNYVNKLGINTCVYCNTQYAITTHLTGGKVNAYYELDHAWPKSLQPFLAISFFNLQPSCGPCNRRKSDTNIPYSIYVDSYSPTTVQFKIEEESLANYILYHNAEQIKIEDKVEDSTLKELHEAIGIGALYNEFKVDAEELVWKAKIYNKSYLDQLSQTFGIGWNKSVYDIFRLKYGVYDGEENVYMRPLTKFKQDIIKQLKRI